MEIINENKNFILGLEVGKIYQRLENKEYVFTQIVHTENTKQLHLLADSFGIAYSIRLYSGEMWSLFESFGKKDRIPLQSSIKS